MNCIEFIVVKWNDKWAIAALTEETNDKVYYSISAYCNTETEARAMVAKLNHTNRMENQK